MPAKGYADDTLSVSEQIAKLETYLTTFPTQLQQISSEELLKRPAPSKWSKKEILGHLIDSGINNLKRFTDIQCSPQPYTIIAYNQNELVLINDYQNLSVEHLTGLWKMLNQQVIFVVNRIPANRLDYPVDPQNENREMKTLGWVICDYVAHMEHHFRQIFSVNEA